MHQRMTRRSLCVIGARDSEIIDRVPKSVQDTFSPSDRGVRMKGLRAPKLCSQSISHLKTEPIQRLLTVFSLPTILGRVCLAGFGFYIAVRCGFDKHLYLTSCLNAHNHNTCIRLPQTGCTARKMALFIISQDRQTQDPQLQVQLQAGDAMATTIIID